MSWASKYIGLPFEEGGRGPVSFDCWGLTRHILIKECGIEIEPFAEIGTFDSPAVEERVRHEVECTDWISISPRDVKDFDVALLWTHRRLLGRHTARSLSHIGIVVSRRLLHIDKATRSVVVKFSRLRPAFEIDSFYRHRRLE